MRRTEPQVVSFRRTDLTPVVGVMEELLAAKGWLTLQPAVATEDAAAHGRQPNLFSGHGPAVPVCTWVPGERTRRGDEYVAVGIEHASGPKAARRLAEGGLPVPDRWTVLQDNPRRGLVVATRPDEPAATVLAWLLDAAAVLSPVALTGEWRALVHRR
jgi:hypothetical protein